MTVKEASPNTRAWPEQRWMRLQAWSGLTFGVFLALHLLNTLAALAGQGAYDGLQRSLRAFYQHPFIELGALLTALLTHIIAGLVRIRRRRALATGAKPAPVSARVRLHRLSAWFLLTVIFGHIAATRGPSLLGIDVDFSYLTFSVEHWPAMILPYYVCLVSAGFYHSLHGLLVSWRLLTGRGPRWLTAPRSVAFWSTIIVGTAALLAAVAAFGGAWFEVDQGRFEEYRKMYEAFAPDGLLPWR